MYNQKILKYKYKLGTSNDLRKKNLYKYKLAHYNQLGGMDLVKKPCNCKDGYVSAAAGDEPPCRCVPTVRLEQPEDDALRREVSDVHKIFESPLLSYMTAFRDDVHNLPTEINFQCSKDRSGCFHYQNKGWSMFFELDTGFDHTKCFFNKYVKEYQFNYKVNKLVIGSLIDLNVLLKSSIFNNLIELKLLVSSNIAEIPDEVSSILQSLQSLNIDGRPIKQLPSLRELKKLSCIDCKYLSELPNLPELLELNSSKCKSLSKLPGGLLNLKILNCSESGLEKIPLLNHLTYLDCNECTKLTEISGAPELIHLNISFTEVEILPLYPELIHLDITFTKVKILPLYPKLKILIANDCFNLSKLESLPLLETLLIKNCINLKELPPLMNLIELLCYGSGFAESNIIDFKHMPKIKRFSAF